jgi:hypothetical protein
MASAQETTVNLFLFTELVEVVVGEVRAAYVAGDVELAVGPNEAKHRYFVTIS